jgi:hypothetical protein
MTPFKPGRYWYTTLGLPDGVTAEVVTIAEGHEGVRFMFRTREQSTQLAARLSALGLTCADSAGVPDGVDPPEIPEHLVRPGGKEA